MKRRRPAWVGLVVIALVAAAFAADHFLRSRSAAPTQFTDLDTALAPVKAYGWELASPPKREGPYRLLPGGPILAGEGLVSRLTNEQGVVEEEVKLQGIEGYDQAVVHLETADGKKTIAVLKRRR